MSEVEVVPKQEGVCGCCGGRTVLAPWPYSGYEADPIEVCPTCDVVPSWPTAGAESKPESGQKEDVPA